MLKIVKRLHLVVGPSNQNEAQELSQSHHRRAHVGQGRRVEYLLHTRQFALRDDSVSLKQLHSSCRSIKLNRQGHQGEQNRQTKEQDPGRLQDLDMSKDPGDE